MISSDFMTSPQRSERNVTTNSVALLETGLPIGDAASIQLSCSRNSLGTASRQFAGLLDLASLVRNPPRENVMSIFSDVWIWLGIVACVVQSALFSGLNLAISSFTQLHLQVVADSGDSDATRLLSLRNNSNQVLATIIWGNVSTNVLLTLLSNSVLTGLVAFFFSAVVITLLGEICPQTYFSRNAMQMTAGFLPFLNFYRVVLFPLAKPTAMLLDAWLGEEGITYPGEHTSAR
jgi:hypothetical protein